MRKLPKSLTRVTGFSKLLALFLIVGFIISAFYAGTVFDQKYAPILAVITPQPTPSMQTSCQEDSDCVLTTENTQNSCCPNTRCLNFADNSTIAVNGKWLEAEKSSVCGKHYMCPMIMAICAKDIVQENAHYSVRCISHTCTKVRN